MKNKHLVLLFLSVLALGLIARWVPFKYSGNFEGNLLQIDTLLLTRIRITAPAQPDLILERTETQWVAEQAGRNSPVADAEIRQMLRILNGAGTYEVVHTLQPDTLGFDPATILRLQLFQKSNPPEIVEIGTEIVKSTGSFTYLRLPEHQGIYLVPGQFRTTFFQNLDNFRSKNVLLFDPVTVQKIGIKVNGLKSYFWNKADSIPAWISADGRSQLGADTVLTWLHLFEKLQGCDFSDNFDETREQEFWYATIHLGLSSGKLLDLHFFYQNPPNIPEDVSRLRQKSKSGLAAFILHSSQNPLNYFTLSDTLLAYQICLGLNRASNSTSSPLPLQQH